MMTGCAPICLPPKSYAQAIVSGSGGEGGHTDPGARGRASVTGFRCRGISGTARKVPEPGLEPGRLAPGDFKSVCRPRN